MMCNDQFQEVRRKIGTLIKDYRPVETWQSIEEICERKWENLYVDFKYELLNNAKEIAENLFGDMTAFVKVNKIKETHNCSEIEAKQKLLEHHFKNSNVSEKIGKFQGKCFMAPLR